jgi:basic amino acid/polyamine antiporter, APA family
MLEWIAGASVVAVGWSSYLSALLLDMGVTLPPKWSTSPVRWDAKVGGRSSTLKLYLCMSRLRGR